MTSFPSERSVVITGVGSKRGIGRAVASRLAQEGWAVGMLDIDAPAVRELAAELKQKYQVRAAGVGVDVSKGAAVRAAVGELQDVLPPVVGLANVAGVSSPAPYIEMDDAEWARVMRVNLDGVHYVTQAVVGPMIELGVGRVVSVSSVSAQRGGGTYSKSAYSTSKAGVIGLTRALARELGPHGITVNAVAPGPIDTDIMGGAMSEERKSELITDLMVNRIGNTRDVAAAISFLLSEENGYITGQVLNVDGGLYMH